MLSQKLEEFGIHERLPSQDPEKPVPVGFGLVHHLVEIIEFDLHLRFIDIDPTSLATEVAAVQNRDVEEGRKVFPLLESALKFLNRKHPLPSKIPRKLREKLFISGSKNS
jgi:hypothetical protein